MSEQENTLQKPSPGLDLGLLLGFNIGLIMGFLTGRKKMSLQEGIIDTIATSTGLYALQISNPAPIERKVGMVTLAGFELNMNNMAIGKKYLVHYDGSKYEVMKNEKNELELFEIG